MAFIHLSSTMRQHFQARATWLCLFAWLVLAQACEQGPKRAAYVPDAEPLEFTQDISRPVWERQGNGWALKMSATSLAFRGEAAAQRVLLQGPDLRVVDARGETILHMAAQNAISLHPFTEMSWRTFSLGNEDATTFEGDELIWPYQAQRDRVGLLGETLLILPTAIVTGDTVVGDLLLRGYEILHVTSVLPLDEAAEDSIDSKAGE
jgi:hypothetical protein